jgi:hypothetical protein
MASRCTAQVLADDGAAAASAAGATPKSVVTSMAGFAWAESAPTAVAASAGAAPVVKSASGGAPQEPAGVSDSAPKSVVASTSMAGFADGGPAPAPEAVVGRSSATASLAAGFADRCPHKPDGLTVTPASRR